MINLLTLNHFRGDLFGGLTAAVVALPLAIAFGVASGAGPVAGIWGAVCVGFFAALFGGTPTQISGPTGPMTIVSASIFTQFANQPAIAFTVVMMAGAFQILFGYLKVGRYINLLPYPVISGFMTGIGCILIIMQIEPLLGHISPPSVMNALTVLPDGAIHPNWQALTVGLAAFLICMLTPKILSRIVPSPLIALIIGSLIALMLSEVPILGPMTFGLPNLQLPSMDFAALNTMLISAAVLAALGSIDSLLTSLVADNVTGSFHNSDKELVGQGIGNLVAGLAGGIAGAGATIRTLSNVNAGGRTPLSGVIHSLALFAVAVGLGPIVAYIPHAALAGVLLKVGIDVIDWQFLKRMHRLPRVDLILMFVVLMLTVFVDVVTAVGVGVVLASLVFVKEMADVQVASINTISDPEHTHLFSENERALLRRCDGHALVLHLSGLISFGAANEMTRKIHAVEDHEVLLIDLCDVPRIDGSAALALEEIIRRAAGFDQEVLLVGLSLPVARLLGHMGALDAVKETARFSSRADAILAAVQFIEQRHRTVV